jgi:hypothetical protein
MLDLSILCNFVLQHYSINMNYYVIVTILFIVIPYLFLLNKKLSIPIKLVFISCTQLTIACLLMLICFFSINQIIAGFLFIYTMAAFTAILVNILIIVIIWLAKKL